MRMGNDAPTVGDENTMFEVVVLGVEASIRNRPVQKR